MSQGRANRLAGASLLVGIVSLVFVMIPFFGPVPYVYLTAPVLAVACFILGMGGVIVAEGRSGSGRRAATWGLVLGMATIVLWFVVAARVATVHGGG